MLICRQCRSQRLCCGRVMGDVQQPFDTIQFDALSSPRHLNGGQYGSDQILVCRSIQSRSLQQGDYSRSIADLKITAKARLWDLVK